VAVGADVGAGVGDGEGSDCDVPWDCARKDPVEAERAIDNTVARKMIRSEIIRPTPKRLICLGLALIPVTSLANEVSLRGILFLKMPVRKS
jgi:hypothetical protein